MCGSVVNPEKVKFIAMSCCVAVNLKKKIKKSKDRETVACSLPTAQRDWRTLRTKKKGHIINTQESRSKYKLKQDDQ